MYEINESNQDSGKGFTGIQDNFELVEVKLGPSGKLPTSPIALLFHFKRGEKFNFTHKVFPVNEEAVAGFSRVDKETKKELPRAEKIRLAYKEKADQIKHILCRFMPENEVILKGATFEEFSNNVIKLLGNKYAGKKLRLKLVYKGQYLSFPKFNFIENMETKPSQLNWDPQWDKATKDTPDQEEDIMSSTAKPAGNSTGSDF